MGDKQASVNSPPILLIGICPAVFALFLFVPTAIGGDPPRFQAIDLGFWPGGMNNSGQVIGLAGELWSNGQVTNFCDLVPTENGACGGNHINERGQIVGGFECCLECGCYKQKAFLITGQNSTVLPLLFGSRITVLKAINNLGQAAGYAILPGSHCSSCSSFVGPRGFVYDARNGNVVELPNLFGEGYTSPNAINNLGHIVGWTGMGTFLWLPTTYEGLSAGMHDLGALTGLPGVSPVINDRFQFVGSDSNYLFAWDDGVVSVHPLGGGWLQAAPWRINNCGSVLGQYLDSPSTGGLFLWDDGTLYDLASLELTGFPQGWAFDHGYATHYLDDAGNIVVTAAHLVPGGETRGFLLKRIQPDFDLSICQVELVQTLSAPSIPQPCPQGGAMQQTWPIIMGKPFLARLYVKMTGSEFPFEDVKWDAVCRVWNLDGSLKDTFASTGAQRTPQLDDGVNAVDSANEDHTLNFLIRAYSADEWAQIDRFEFELNPCYIPESAPGSGGPSIHYNRVPENDFLNNMLSIPGASIDVREQKKLEIGYVLVELKNDSLEPPTKNWVIGQEDMFRDVFPVPNLRFKYHGRPWHYGPSIFSDVGKRYLIDSMASLRAGFRLDALVTWVGSAPNLNKAQGSDLMNVLWAPAAPDPDYFIDGPHRALIAHEMGHVFNVCHVHSYLEDVGVSSYYGPPFLRTQIPPGFPPPPDQDSRLKGIMFSPPFLDCQAVEGATSGSLHHWMTSFEYQAFWDSQELQQSSRLRIATNACPSLWVSGTFATSTSDVSLFLFHEMPSGDLTESDPVGTLIARTFANSVVVSEIRVSPESPYESPAGSDRLFAVQVPLYSDVECLERVDRVDILDAATNVLLAQRTRSPNGPQLTIAGPATGANIGPGSYVSFAASDADGDAMEFEVSFSADGGATYWPLAHMESHGEIPFGSASVPGSLSGMSRIAVEASDGFNVTRVEVGGLTHYALKPPEVSIRWPDEGRSFADGMTLFLSAAADDLEDGELTGASVQWASDRDGNLGSGAELAVADLSIGIHTLAVQATDSHGMSAMDTVGIIIGARNTAPGCGNGLCEAGEHPCNCAVDCGVPQLIQAQEAACTDNIDNDCDGLRDCADQDCSQRVYGDLAPLGNRDGIVELGDLLCLLNGYGSAALCPGSDIAPCSGDGITELADVLAILATYAGTPPCTDPCP